MDKKLDPKHEEGEPLGDTKPCPVCGHDMIEQMHGMMMMSYPPQGSLYWDCMNCEHSEFSRNL